ncbi:MAG TPA: NUDIX domain-containing protein [Thermoplasmata archaeon]|nr:NUDIX domain-containing protein [Thermoplasmata archaeon]
MPLPAVGVFPGRAAGAVHLVDDPLRWTSGRSGPEVLAVPALWWPPERPFSSEVVGVILHGVPSESSSVVEVPTVARVDSDVIREGETVEVNGTLGQLRIEGVEEVNVVTAFLQRSDDRILLLQRSEKVGSFRGHWAAVSGFLEAATPLEQCFREIEEEVGLHATDIELLQEGSPILARDGSKVFIVHTFRFRAKRTAIRLDWEHTQAEWVEATEIRRRTTVPKLDRAWESVAAVPPKG